MAKLIWQTVSSNPDETKRLGELFGCHLQGGETIELLADLGGGKTTFTQGLAKGLISSGNVSSPTFTLSKIYECRDGLEIHHFDFYRLSEPGILADQLAESVSDPRVVTVVEWSNIVSDVLRKNRISVKFEPTPNDPDERLITITYPESATGLIKAIETGWEEVKP